MAELALGFLRPGWGVPGLTDPQPKSLGVACIWRHEYSAGTWKSAAKVECQLGLEKQHAVHLTVD